MMKFLFNILFTLFCLQNSYAFHYENEFSADYQYTKIKPFMKEVECSRILVSLIKYYIDYNNSFDPDTDLFFSQMECDLKEQHTAWQFSKSSINDFLRSKSTDDLFRLSEKYIRFTNLFLKLKHEKIVEDKIFSYYKDRVYETTEILEQRIKMEKDYE